MFVAARNEEDRASSLLQLALGLVVDQAERSAELTDYLNEVVRQALALRADPAGVVAPILPEAIDLALEMVTREQLADALGELNQAPALDPALAKRVLDVMSEHRAFAY